MKTKLFYGMVVLAALGLTACSSEDLAPNSTGQIAETDMTRYISVRISNPSTGGTRADENIPGYQVDENENESKVNKIYFVFYDNDNNVVGDIVNVDNFSFTSIEGNPNTPSNGLSAQKVVGVSIQKGEKLPAKVLVYINPITPEGILNNLNVIETLKRSVVRSPDGYFPMSNSVYYDNKGSLCNIVNIAENGLFKTVAEAEAALKDISGSTILSDEQKKKVTDIHVERYAAKVQLKWEPKKSDKSDNTTPEYTDVKNKTYEVINGILTEKTIETKAVKLKFIPNKWDVNAESKEMFIIKAFRGQDALGGLTINNASYSSTENVLGLNNAENWIWNRPEDHRSFWGCSPSYYSLIYPEVADDYTKDNNGEMLLKYLKWTDVEENGLDVSNTFTTDYVKETTVGKLGLHDSPNHYATIPSIIVTGNYKVTIGDIELPEETTFYLYGLGTAADNEILFENAKGSLESAVKNGDDIIGNSLLKRLAFRQQTVWIEEATPVLGDDGKVKTDDNGIEIINKTYRSLSEEEMAQVFVVDHPSQSVLNMGAEPDPAGTTIGAKNVKLASRKFTLQLSNNISFVDKGSTKVSLVYNDGKEGGYKKILVDDETQTNTYKNIVNLLLSRNVGYADKYTNGMAYFNIPIKHYGWYRPGNKNRERYNEEGNVDGYEENRSINWEDTHVGDFGIVRNHHYQIQVTKVDGLATAIADENTPIIPPQETEEHYIAYRLYILNWAILPVQDAEL